MFFISRKNYHANGVVDIHTAFGAVLDPSVAVAGQKHVACFTVHSAALVGVPLLQKVTMASFVAIFAAAVEQSVLVEIQVFPGLHDAVVAPPNLVHSQVFVLICVPSFPGFPGNPCTAPAFFKSHVTVFVEADPIYT